MPVFLETFWVITDMGEITRRVVDFTHTEEIEGNRQNGADYSESRTDSSPSFSLIYSASCPVRSRAAWPLEDVPSGGFQSPGNQAVFRFGQGKAPFIRRRPRGRSRRGRGLRSGTDRQEFIRDQGAVLEDHGPFDGVLELPDVARPVVASSRSAPSESPGSVLVELRGEKWRGSASAERRMSSFRSRAGAAGTRTDVEPVEEVLAELSSRTGARGPGWSPRRRGRRPRRPRPADARRTSGCSRNAQQLGLEAGGMSPISSRRSVPPCASSKSPCFRPWRR